MPILPNPRHERFAQELAKGKSAREAYETAGYTPNDGNASTLRSNQKVIDRLDELMALKAERAIVDREWVIARLVDNAKTCMALDFVRDPNGDITALVTHNPAAANKALELIGKEIGMFADKLDATLTVNDGTERDAERFASGITSLAARVGKTSPTRKLDG